jgi:hypothetical protein
VKGSGRSRRPSSRRSPGRRSPRERVVALAMAVRSRRRVRLRHRSGLGEETERRVDPYAVVHRKGYWYAVAQDHLRGRMRLFRLDRVLEAEGLEKTFVRPPASTPRNRCSIRSLRCKGTAGRWRCCCWRRPWRRCARAGTADGDSARTGGGRRGHALLHLRSGLDGASLGGPEFPVRDAPAIRASEGAHASRRGGRHPRGACQRIRTTAPTLKDRYWSVCRWWISWCTARRLG